MSLSKTGHFLRGLASASFSLCLYPLRFASLFLLVESGYRFLVLGRSPVPCLLVLPASPEAGLLPGEQPPSPPTQRLRGFPAARRPLRSPATCSLLCLPPPGVLGRCPPSSGGKVDGRGGLNSVRWLSRRPRSACRGAMLSRVTPPVGPSWNICFCLGRWVCVDPLSVSTRELGLWYQTLFHAGRSQSGQTWERVPEPQATWPAAASSPGRGTPGEPAASVAAPWAPALWSDPSLTYDLRSGPQLRSRP